MTAALDGVTIVDLSRDVAGSYAAMLLAEQGAKCIKVETPANGTHLPPVFSLHNRSKRSLTLDVAQPAGYQVLGSLLEKVDILIQDYGVENTTRLKLDYTTLSKRYPRMIYCSITPWGEKGPDVNKPADDALIAAFAGTFGGQGGYGQPPVFVFLPFWVYATSILTAYGASLALFAREATGRGQKIETSLLAGALAMEVGAFLQSPTIVPVTAMRSVQQGVVPAYRLYQCQDDWIMIACGNTTFWNKLCLAIDRVDLLGDARFEGMPWALPDVNNRIILTDILAGIFAQKPRASWLELLTAADVPCAPVNTRKEFMADPQVKQNQMIVETDDYHYGKMRQMGIPLALTDNPTSPIKPRPRSGQHTTQILRELGLQESEIAGLRERGII